MVKLKTSGADGKPLWAYRYRLDGRGSAKPQVVGFASQRDEMQALNVALERLRRRNGRLPSADERHGCVRAHGEPSRLYALRLRATTSRYSK